VTRGNSFKMKNLSCGTKQGRKGQKKELEGRNHPQKKTASEGELTFPHLSLCKLHREWEGISTLGHEEKLHHIRSASRGKRVGMWREKTETNRGSKRKNVRPLVGDMGGIRVNKCKKYPPKGKQRRFERSESKVEH